MIESRQTGEQESGMWSTCAFSSNGAYKRGVSGPKSVRVGRGVIAAKCTGPPSLLIRRDAQ